MIFCSKNEKGEYAWRLVLNGRKTVTRRLKPIPIGKIKAVQPLRGRKAVGYIKIISCQSHNGWFVGLPTGNKQFTDEAEKEGFYSWHGLLDWFADHKIKIFDTYRMEFELVNKDV